MINIINENSLKIPKLPSKIYNTQYKYLSLTLKDEDGSESPGFDILKSGRDATKFVLNVLSNGDFPMVPSSTYFNYYQEDPEWYKEDMINFSKNKSCLSNDESLYFNSDGTNYVFDNFLNYEESIIAFRRCGNIQQLLYNADWGSIIYKGFIIWEYDMWRAVDNIKGYLGGSLEDYQWKNIRGTYIMLPDWAESFDSIIK